MPHTSRAARKRSKNPAARRALFDTSPFSRGGMTRNAGPAGGALFNGAGGVRTGGPVGRGVPLGGGRSIGQLPTAEGPSAAPSPGLMPSSALGPGGPFLISTDNPFVAANFFGQQGGGSNIPSINTSFIGQRVANLPPDANEAALRNQAMDRLGRARVGDVRAQRRGETLAEGEGATADAARLLAPALRNNPFITDEGLANLQRGVAPELNQIDPAFFTHTSPVIKEALLGLLQSLGQRPQDVDFFTQATRPI